MWEVCALFAPNLNAELMHVQILGLNLSDAPTVDEFWPIITNTEAIAVNQDYAGMSGTNFYSSSAMTAFAPCGWWSDNCSFPSQQFWWKPLSDGSTAILLMNSGVASADLVFNFSAIPSMAEPGAAFSVRDIWAHADLGQALANFTAPAVGPRDSAFLRFTPVQQSV